MKKLLLSSISAIALLSAASAQAQETWPRWYLGLNGSVTFVDDSDVDGVPGNAEISSDTGWGAGITLGYNPAFTSAPLNNLRFDVELGYRENSLDSFTAGGVSNNQSGDITSWAYLLNGYYDFKNSSQWTPYVGAGLGGAEVEMDNITGLGNGNDNDHVFAYQFMAGISYAPTSIPYTDWSLGYKYFATSSPTFDVGTSDIEVDYDTHNVEVGARFRF